MNDLDIEVTLNSQGEGYQQHGKGLGPPSRFKNLVIDGDSDDDEGSRRTSKVSNKSYLQVLDGEGSAHGQQYKKMRSVAVMGGDQESRKGGLQLNNSLRSMEAGTMSCELGSQGIKVHREGYEIGQFGMKDMHSGQMIVGNLSEEDLDYGGEPIVLGNGASGYVYLATHTQTAQQLAIKSINVFDQGKRRQLVNDLRSLQKHDCPFLINFMGAMFEDGQVKIALEFMDMGSLKSLLKLALKKDGQRVKMGLPLIEEPIVAKIFQQVLCGLAYLNVCMKQMHRDIKPDNVLLNKRGFVKVTDFGISKQYGGDESEKSRTQVGTLTYMSPERMEGGKYYSYAGDIWSLGIMLIEIVTGEFPFKEEKGFLAMLDQILEQESPNVPNNGNYSPELMDFIEKCLKKDPEARSSTHELLAHPWIHKYTQSQANLPKYFKYLAS